jgi:ATP-dependent RNA helicase DeaD
MKFQDLQINPKLKNRLHHCNFTEPTPIQEKCIHKIIQGTDVVGQAETGSGKTLAFCLPILEKIHPTEGLQVLILTPTRELCQQVTDVFHEFGKCMGIKVISIYGGVSINPQIKQIPKSHIVVGTPGRILDHLQRKTISFRKLRFLVLDETDKMLDMGFIDDVEQIIHQVPIKRQTLMFSATLGDDVFRVAKKHLRNPLIIRTRSLVDPGKLKQVYYDIYKKDEKFSLLVHLLNHSTPGLALVFCGTRNESEIVGRNLLRMGINASVIHGGMNQHKRTRSLEKLKREKVDVLVATDVAARGLDIKNVTHVYNYDVPKTSKEYIHRIGRTARAGENGDAVTLLTARDHDNFRRVQSNEQLRIRLAKYPQFKKVPFLRKYSHPRK